MFDNRTAELIRAAPQLSGVDPALLPQELTGIYAELAGLRLRRATLADNPVYAERIRRIERIATIYEALVDDNADGESRRAAAFVAGTAYQLLGRVVTQPENRESYLTAAAIHPRIAAPLLFLVAEQSADSREAAKDLAGPRLDDIHRGALLESLYDLAQERFELILDRADRLARLRPSPDVPLAEQATQALFGLCWSGVVRVAAQLLDRATPAMQFQALETPQLTFDRVVDLSTRVLNVPAGGARLVSSYSGPRHLARLLRHTADSLEGRGIVRLESPPGAQATTWRGWLRHRARTKPTLWPNHRRALETNFLGVGNSGVLVLPTGAGKTTLSELKIAATLSSGKKVIFLVPTLALVDQLRDDLSESFPKSVSNTDVSADGDLTALIAGIEFKAIEVMTPERLLAVLSFTDADMSEIGLIVFDECHLLSPDGGGARSTDAMLCLLHAVKRAPTCDFLLLSAMLRNSGEISDWLGQITQRPCVNFLDTWKPSRQARGVVVYPELQIRVADRSARARKRSRSHRKRFNGGPLIADPFALFGLQHAWVRDVPEDIRLVKLLNESVELGVGAWGASPNANKVGAALASQAASAGLKTIIFVQKADHAPSTAKLLHNLKTPSELTAKENEYWMDIVVELGAPSCSMIDPTSPALPHNGDMIAVERRLAEALFRKTGGVDVIVATPTLAQGMNLPAQVAILASTMRHDDDGRKPLKNHEILNAAGRAGRAGHLANGTVLLVPEPIATFASDGRPSNTAYEMLTAVLPQNDQCVDIKDPLTRLLDAIQSGQHNTADVQYFLSRIRSGEPEEQAIDRAIEMMRRSLAAFQAHHAEATENFEAKLVALRLALVAEAMDTNGPTIKVAAFSGFAVEPLAALSSYVEANIENLPTTVVGWTKWLVDFCIGDRTSYSLLFGSDVETVKAVTRGKKSGGESTPEEFARLKEGIQAWLEGRPFNCIEQSLGALPSRVGYCPRARDLVLRLANRRLYLLANAASAIVREILVTHSRVSANPAVLEILAVAIRKGLDSPEKVAFAYRRPLLRSRVMIHRAYDNALGGREPILGADYATILRTVEAQIVFGLLDDLEDGDLAIDPPS